VVLGLVPGQTVLYADHSIGPFEITPTREGETLVVAAVEDLSVPRPFTPSEVKIVQLQGMLPSGCYRIAPPTAKVNLENQTVEVIAQAFFRSGVICTKALVPYQVVAEIRQPMPAGVYQVVVRGQEGVQTELEVDQALPEQDHAGQLKAYVSSVTLEKAQNGRPEIVIEGHHPHPFIGCIELDRIDTAVSEDAVITVDPFIRFSEVCDRNGPEDNGYVGRVSLEDGLTRGRYIIHVRGNDESDSLYKVVEWK